MDFNCLTWEWAKWVSLSTERAKQSAAEWVSRVIAVVQVIEWSKRLRSPLKTRLNLWLWTHPLQWHLYACESNKGPETCFLYCSLISDLISDMFLNLLIEAKSKKSAEILFWTLRGCLRLSYVKNNTDNSESDYQLVYCLTVSLWSDENRIQFFIFFLLTALWSIYLFWFNSHHSDHSFDTWRVSTLSSYSFLFLFLSPSFSLSFS